jgi:hypothetical protein
MLSQRIERLREIKTFPSLVKYLRDELDWPIESEDFEELTYEYEPEELGIDAKTAVKIKEIKQLRPLSSKQPWGIFFINFEPKQLPIVVLRRILRSLVVRKRADAKKSQQAAWQLHDLLFISSYGESDHREITFAHFSEPVDRLFGDLPTLRVLGWDDDDTKLKMEHVVQVMSQKLRWPANEVDSNTWRKNWNDAFELRPREVITTSKELAIRLAGLAKSIRQRANLILGIESEKGSLRKLHKAFQTALIHDLNEDDFADMYAQTIAYGLLAARVSRPAGIIADNLADMIPTNPFLKDMLGTFLTVGGRKSKIDFDELGIQEVVDLLNRPDTHIEAVMRDFGKKTMQEDPVVHFYELFLKEYDKKKKVERGVFYTPQPVVSYIVRSVHELLKTEFGLEDGLASIVTWGELVKRNPEIKIPDGVSPDEPFVLILDIATGTATFLVEVIEVIYNTMLAKWKKAGHLELEMTKLWNEYVPKHLLPRLYGFELMMAPYAIAHMKIGLKLAETGYRFGSNERAHIYLTNSLEPPTDAAEQPEFEEMAPALAHEAKAVNAVKRHKRFTVVMGNPPYSIHSQNLTNTARAWVDTYRYVDGKLIREKGALQFEKSLQDDCVKFANYSQTQIIKASAGVLGLIMSHSFVDNPTLRGMRHSFMQTFNDIFIIDLHGNYTKKERCPDGSEDKNVFDIKQGVGMLIGACKTIATSAVVRYAEAWGPRELKYTLLLKNSLYTTDFKSVEPRGPYYLFKPQSADTRVEFERGIKVTEIFAKGNVGIITARDNMVIDFEARPLVERTKLFRDSKLADKDLCDELEISLKKGWAIAHAREIIKHDKDLEKYVKPLCYRPFDSRLIFYHPSLVWGMSYPTMQHMLSGGNLAMMIGRAGQVIGQGEWDIVFCTRGLTEFNLYRRGGHNLLPLYLVPDEGRSQGELAMCRHWRPNFSPSFLKAIAETLRVRQEGEHNLPHGLTRKHLQLYLRCISQPRLPEQIC